MNAARFLTQGADVWLNNPRRPLEASGTSGMKAAVNGVLNLSVLDGWWAEGYRPEAGWAIGRGEEYQDLAYQDEVEANALYDLLEKEVIPTFYDRGRNGMPRAWVARMKGALRWLCPVFNTTRMVHDYAQRVLPAGHRRARAPWRPTTWSGRAPWPPGRRGWPASGPSSASPTCRPTRPAS